MKFCPFCGSPAAAWPEYASDYVRGYPLCEHHMKSVLAGSTHYEYDNYRLEYESRWEKISELVLDFANKEAQKMSATYSNIPALQSESAYDWPCKVCEDFMKALGSAVFVSPVSKGDPVSTSIVEEEVDRLISIRITGFARDSEAGKDVHRCSAKKEFSSDGRCINRVKNNNEICSSCKKKKLKVGVIDSGKMNQIMEIIRQ